MKVQKSPLRYPGGKSRAVETVLKLIPESETKLVSPFMGGGSIELACASKGMKVFAYDIFEPLVTFWNELLKDPKKLVKEIRKHYPLSKEEFYKLQKKILEMKNPTQLGASFFILNRSSFSGSTLSGGMSPDHPRFTESSIQRLLDFNIKNISVSTLDFKKALVKHQNILAYCDPPYLIKNTLYGNKGDTHRGFDHQGLFEILKNRKKWILSYNDSPEIREMYKGFKIISPQWKYGMSEDKDSREVIILSPDLK